MRLIHEDRAIHKISGVMRLVSTIIEVQVRSYTSELDTDSHMYVCRQYKKGQLQTLYITTHSHTPHDTCNTQRERHICMYMQAHTGRYTWIGIYAHRQTDRQTGRHTQTRDAHRLRHTWTHYCTNSIFLPIASQSNVSATDFALSTRMAFSNACCRTILLHSSYFALASPSLGLAFLTCVHGPGTMIC